MAMRFFAAWHPHGFNLNLSLSLSLFGRRLPQEKTMTKIKTMTKSLHPRNPLPYYPKKIAAPFPERRFSG
jgi:hypothetical protein